MPGDKELGVGQQQVGAGVGAGAEEGGDAMPDTAMEAAGTSDEEELDAADPTGALHECMEDCIFSVVREMLDEAQGLEVAQQMASGGWSVAQLKQHMSDMFASNTEEVSRLKFGDWVHYCKIVYGRQPNIEEVTWPPSVEQWVHFLLSVRPKVFSYKRFLNLVGNVAHIASQHWEKKTGTPSTKLQPSVLYPSAHKQAIATVRRQYGMGMKQVMPKAITMIEARNGTLH